MDETAGEDKWEAAWRDILGPSWEYLKYFRVYLRPVEDVDIQGDIL